MKFFLAILVWVIMGAIIGTGMVLAVKGSPWLLILSVVGFCVAVGKIGCSQH
jgi:hypothetical protein